MDRRMFCGAAVAAALMPAPQTRAASDPVYTGLVAGVGAGGYDVVAYQAEGRAVRGDPAIVASHAGVSWRFASAESRAAFLADPERFLPRYGGYCAWAVANGYTAKGDPEAWSVVGGRLYLNYSKSIRSRWEKDIPGHIASGDANWPKVID